MDCKIYNQWRQDISAEYVIRTGRAFPSISTRAGKTLRKTLVYMSDDDCPLDPCQAVDWLISNNFLLA